MYVIDTHRVASVHLPRIGHSTPHFNWYGTERLIRKHLVMRKIPTLMYPLDSKGNIPDSSACSLMRTLSPVNLFSPSPHYLVVDKGYHTTDDSQINGAYSY